MVSVKSTSQLQRFRFIPAPAGNSPQFPRSNPPAAVHPRACGEQGSPCSRYRRLPGSSPRLRGTVLLMLAQPAAFRFIPAPAGNSQPSFRTYCRLPVHPRACGEQLLSSVTVISLIGSSPRLRGTAGHRLPGLEPGRFIPAPAGNSNPPTPDPPRPPVHPRACGEQLRPVSRARSYGRFIPAPAGNRDQTMPSVPHTTVHPRACGEQGHILDRHG